MTDKSAAPVIITRPLLQAGALAQRVAAMGRRAEIFPLLEIHPLADPSPLQVILQRLADYAMVAFVSPNAIDAVFGMLKKWPPQVMIAVVGEGSKAALARHGITSVNAKIISPVDPVRTDSQTLLEVLDFEVLRDRRVLIVRGQSGRELLSDALRSKGVQVEQITAYRREAPVLDQSEQERLLRLLDAEGDWVITSSEALRVLVRMVEECADSAGVAKLQQQKLVVPHIRIAETARFLGFTHVTSTGSGDEHVLAALQSRA